MTANPIRLLLERANERREFRESEPFTANERALLHEANVEAAAVRRRRARRRRSLLIGRDS